jgi:hypothetical protein
MKSLCGILFFVSFMFVFQTGIDAAEITNGGFEQDFADWRYFAVDGAEANFTIVNDAYEGNKAASIEVTAGGGDHALDRETNRIPINPEEVIKISFAAKKISSGETRMSLTVSEFDSSGTWLGGDANTDFVFNPSSGDYSVHEAVFMPKMAATAYINIGFRIEDEFRIKVPGHYYVDNVVFSEGEIFYNGGFESGQIGWRAYAVSGAAGNFGLSNDAYEGSNAFSFEITAGGGDHGLDRWDSKIPITYGQTVGVSAATKKLSGQDTVLKMILSQWSLEGTHVGDVIYTLDSGVGEYKVNQVGFTVTNPDAARLNVCFRIEDSFGIKVPGHYLIDDVKLIDLPRLYNGGFESDLLGWSGIAVGGAAGNFTITNDAYEGAKAASLEVTTGGGDALIDRENAKVAVTANETIGVRFAAKKISGNDTRIKLTIAEHAQDGSYLLSAGERMFDVGSEYSVCEFNYGVQNPDTAFVNVAFRCVDEFNFPAPGHYYIDAVELETLPTVFNGGFEDGLDGWRGYALGAGTFTISTDAYEGSSAAIIDITDAAGDHALDRENAKIAVGPNQIRTFSFAAKRVSAEERALRFTVSEFDAAGNYLASYGLGDFWPTTEYSVYDFSYMTTNPDCAKVNIAFTMYNAQITEKATGQMLIDDVKLVNTQLVTNPGFEQNLDFWRHYAIGGAEAEYTISTDAYKGARAALMTVTTAGEDQALDRELAKLPVSAGDTLRVSFAAKNAGGGDNLLLLNVAEFDSEGNYLAQYGLKFVDPPADGYGEFEYYYALQDPEAGYVNIAFTIFDGTGSAKAAGSYLIDEVRVYSNNGLNPADVNFDSAVDADDVTKLSDYWLTNEVVPGDSVSVDDFEGYMSSSELESAWTEFYWSNFNGSNTSSTVSLLTDPADVYSGSQSMRWEYNADDTTGNDQDFTDIVFELDEPVDLSGAASITMNLNRHEGNSQEYLLYVKCFEGVVDVSTLRGQGVWLTRSEGSTFSPTGWTQWTANLDEYVDYSKVDLDEVTAILIGCYSPASDGTSGSGVIDIDDISIVYESVCEQTAGGDVNGDCVVDFTDYAAISANWLDQIIY